MPRTTEVLKARCLCIDIETHRRDRAELRELGIFRPDLDVRARIAGDAPDLLERLNQLAEGAAFVLGHNIVAHDQPILALLHPQLTMHQLPLVDTLELSPVAFPQNPYHRLVKDYKLCSTTRNDPVRDAELAYTLFVDQREAFKAGLDVHPDEIACLHFLLTPDDATGVGKLFATLRGTLRPSLQAAREAWRRATGDKTCVAAQQKVLDEFLVDPTWHKPLAYALAWLRVAGGNSVLPPWVGVAHPRTREAIALLRDVPCGDASCLWCRQEHDLSLLLPRYFPGITRFRSSPSMPDGRSMQQVIVENTFAGRSTLAVLPTGGGKSLCYQLPALARFYRNGSLTVVISPLQSLMKDQVDNLESRGITCAGYLNGLLNPMERRTVLDKIRLGDIGLIFVAPEQFRSRAFTGALTYREVGAWVFDEAHCLSKWGHDFRPDYLYVSRFIKGRDKDRPSPVFCFTATAKPDVVDDIRNHFKMRLAVDLECIEGGVTRDNLVYEVHSVAVQAKYPEVLRLLRESLAEEGGAIVFCARQKTVESLAAFLQESGVECGFFHGGMLPADKRAVQEAFLAGSIRVIAATNAFGMGVDKPDVRLVIHLDTPGSLENYLQEAGRAGRDQDRARCILLHDEADLDVQFRLLRNARLSQHDIHVILKALRAIERKDRSEGSVVVTSGEILLEVPERHRIDPDSADADTKVRIAIAWLEEARLLARHENHVRVFPGSLQVADLDEARQTLRHRLGHDTDIEPYLSILGLLFQAQDDEGVSTDDLVIATGQDSRTVQAMLRDLDRFNLLSNDIEIGVTLYRDPDTPPRLDELEKIENALVASLREAAPDADRDSWQVLDMRRLCDTLRRDTLIDLEPQRVSRLLKSFAESFGDGPGHRGLFSMRPHGSDHRHIRLLREWRDIETIRARRMHLARAMVSFFLERRKGNQSIVTCTQGELERALQTDLTLQDLDIRDWGVALAAVLIYLDTNEVLHLARGKAVFRSAMSIELNAEARRRQFSKGDYAGLALHYEDKIVQVHVMAEYAKLAIGKIQAAMGFILDYFSLERDEFIRRHFAGRKELLERATTESAHRRIVVDLADPAQQDIVTSRKEGNRLVLAGPGSGKTRIIVHRVAWLLREVMVLPEEILVLAYNRSAVMEIRRRLWGLVGSDAAGVSVQTLHALAMRLTGTSYAVAAEHGEMLDFDAVIRLATARLRRSLDDEETSGSIYRDRALSGLRHLLVDEYQDINGDHFEFISAIAGRTLEDANDRLSLMVVGDDDQNIYAFGGASARYIRKFEAHYKAYRHHLLENYRSTAHIIQCANRVIESARDRMKRDAEIRIDHARREEPAGGDHARRDPVAQGRMHILEVPNDALAEAGIALDELLRLNRLDGCDDTGWWSRFAVIARRWDDLDAMAAICRARHIPVRLLRDHAVPDLHTTREGDMLLGLLRGVDRRLPRSRPALRANTLSRWFRGRFGIPVDGVIDHPPRAMLAQFIEEYEASAPGSERVVSDLVESLYEFRHGNPFRSENRINAPMLLLTAHRAKGLEFEHVLLLDGGGWSRDRDEERRLFYVAMTRARKSLTICQRMGVKHAFTPSLDGLALRSRPEPPVDVPMRVTRTWFAAPEHIWLSWPGEFPANAPVHRALARLEVGDVLTLGRPNADARWELRDAGGVTVTVMSQKFAPPAGDMLAVRVASILVRREDHGSNAGRRSRVARWELVLPEIEYRPVKT